MKRKGFLGLLSLLFVSMLLLAACSSEPNSANDGATSQPAETQYLTREDLKTDIEGGKSYIILDVRKVADYDTKHISGAFSADVDSSVSDSNNTPSTANLKAAVKEATGSEKGNSDSKFVLVCYSGKRYAAAATEILIEIGVPAGNIYTLEGGNNGWAEAGDEYTSLME